ncbi:unnamed protein product [Microthlaspi erraticum]|uniref:Uncharacterized protein n=1 Tax=Microthlaspi erraticum TaxID=1685480 RepID=A0A6D2IPX3_9BRAS|nr:unnamed protein product [Microthlaspi erraticum]
MEISYLDKQEGYENSAPQRTGRQGRGLERADGHQEHSTRLLSLDRACSPLLPSSSRSGVASLALVELCSLEAVVRGPVALRKSW